MFKLVVKRGGQVYFVHNRVESIFSIGDLVQRLVPEARYPVALLHNGQFLAAFVEPGVDQRDGRAGLGEDEGIGLEGDAPERR